MHKRRNIVLYTFLGTFLFVGCASSKVDSLHLIESQKSYEKLRLDPQINQYAAASLFQAGKLYNLSKSASNNDEANHYAYLLKQEVLVAKESALTKQLQEKMDRLRLKKTEALLEAKEGELLKAKQEALRAKERAQGLEQRYQELQELNAKMTSRGLVLTLGDVLFGVNKAALMAGAQRSMEKLVDFLAENETRKVLIEGHTDNVGSSTYNLDLSLRRANAVAEVLKAKGVDASRIVTKGYGELYPVTTNTSAIGKQQNRRVEIVILNEGDKIEDITR